MCEWCATCIRGTCKSQGLATVCKGCGQKKTYKILVCPQPLGPDVPTSDEEFEDTVSETTRHPPQQQEQPWRPNVPTLDTEFEDTVSETKQHLPPQQELVYIDYQQGNGQECLSDLNPNPDKGSQTGAGP